MKKYIVVKNEFIGFHRYKDAPEEVAFLREYHRHIFKVSTMFEVDGLNRDLEFFIEQRKVQKVLDEHYTNKYFDESCEQIALKILTSTNSCKVVVSEDGENEAIIINT